MTGGAAGCRGKFGVAADAKKRTPKFDAFALPTLCTLPGAAQCFADRYDANSAGKNYCAAQQIVPNRFDPGARNLICRVSL
jgi:hypothetical protein